MDEFALRPEASKDRVWDFPAVQQHGAKRQHLFRADIRRAPEWYRAANAAGRLAVSRLSKVNVAKLPSQLCRVWWK